MALERDNEKNVKKKSAKSKLSKPTVKKQQAYSIEIGMGSVKIIKTDAKGKITGAGMSSYDMGDTPLWTDKAWIDRLSQSVREASREARVPKGTGFACTVVTGGTGVIVQRFTWPELNYQAMLENAKHEIASYLPGTQSQFIIGAEVQSRNETESAVIIDAFVAAMPKDMATAISTAVTWAGFKVVSLDVKENARTRLINKFCMIEGGAPKSYGILDLCGEQPNITLYLGGHFYSTHYFGGSVSHQAGKAAPGTTIEEIEETSGFASAAIKSEQVEFDVEVVLSEISFVVDFIKYQERGSGLECILILGRTQPGFSQRLSSGLDMPVYDTDAWMKSSVIEGIKGDPGLYLDAYASGIVSSVIGAHHMLDLKTAVIVKKPMRRLFMIASGLILFMLAALAVGIFIPFRAEQRLQREYADLDIEEERVNRFVAESRTAAEIEHHAGRVEFYGTRLVGIDDFYREFAQASVIVPIFFDAVVTNIYQVEDTGFTDIFQLTVSEDEIVLDVTAIHFNHVAALIEYFRDFTLEGHLLTLFRSAGTAAVTDEDTLELEYGSTTFSMGFTMRRGMGVR
ncbi:MAG: hypothetical protein FWF79_05230 [Defluviitaleaceae bacterium]|nr:hypothetical protein [Defluviitaleaceae bacterium]